jgi:hypothetical protein
MISRLSNFKVIIYDYPWLSYTFIKFHHIYATLLEENGVTPFPMGPNGLGWGNLQGPTNELADATLRIGNAEFFVGLQENIDR